MLDTVARAEHALAALRRDLLTGTADTDLAAAELAALAARLHTRAATKPVTEPVTEPAAEVGASAPAELASETMPPTPVTEPMEPLALDPDRVRLIQAADYAQSGVWQVEQDTETGTCAQFGTLIPVRTGGTGRGKRWTARDQAWLPISGGPWKTRQDALLHLLMHYQDRANVRRGPTFSPR